MLLHSGLRELYRGHDSCFVSASTPGLHTSILLLYSVLDTRISNHCMIITPLSRSTIDMLLQLVANRQIKIANFDISIIFLMMMSGEYLVVLRVARILWLSPMPIN